MQVNSIKTLFFIHLLFLQFNTVRLYCDGYYNCYSISIYHKFSKEVFRCILLTFIIPSDLITFMIFLNEIIQYIYIYIYVSILVMVVPLGTLVHIVTRPVLAVKIAHVTGQLVHAITTTQT